LMCMTDCESEAQRRQRAKDPLLVLTDVGDLPDPAALRVTYIEGTIRSLREAHGPVLRGTVVPYVLHAGEAIGEGLIGAGLAVREGQEVHPESRLGQRRPVPGTVEAHEHAALVARRELFAGVAQQRFRRPMAGERGDGLAVPGAIPLFLSIATVFRRQHLLLLQLVVVAVGPA